MLVAELLNELKANVSAEGVFNETRIAVSCASNEQMGFVFFKKTRTSVPSMRPIGRVVARTIATDNTSIAV